MYAIRSYYGRDIALTNREALLEMMERFELFFAELKEDVRFGEGRPPSGAGAGPEEPVDREEPLEREPHLDPVHGGASRTDERGQRNNFV